MASTIYSSTTDFPGLAAALPVFGTSMILIAGRPDGREHRIGIGRVLGVAGLQWVGRRSYSWYLWHWPILVMATAAWPNLTGLGRVCLACFALFLADLTYRFVETPLRSPVRLGDRPATPVRGSFGTLLAGLATTIVVLALSTAVRQFAIAASTSPSQRAYTMAASDVARPYRDGCVNEVKDARVHVCTYGVPGSRTTIALFGDSHAVQWFPALEAIALSRGWSLLVVAKTRCATADVPVFEVGTWVRSDACARWRQAAIDTIERRRPAFTVLSNASVYVRRPGLPSNVPAVSLDVWKEGVMRTLVAFRARKIPTLVIGDTPLLSTNVPVCLARSGWISRVRSSCATERRMAVDQALWQLEAQAAAATSGHYVNLVDELCQPASCGPVVAGTVAYSDNEHLTATLARALASSLNRAMDQSGIVDPPSLR